MTLTGRKTARRIESGYDSPVDYIPAAVGGEATSKVSAHLKGINNALATGKTDAVVDVHKITAGETTAGYFTLSKTPFVAASVTAVIYGGAEQVNKAAVGSSGVTPDFEMDGTNPTRIYFLNLGGHTGLSETWTTDDVIIVSYVGR